MGVLVDAKTMFLLMGKVVVDDERSCCGGRRA